LWSPLMMGCGFTFHPHPTRDGDPFHPLFENLIWTAVRSVHKRVSPEY
jgi:hypothetical protein